MNLKRFFYTFGILLQVIVLTISSRAAESTIPGSRYAGKLDPHPVPMPATRPTPANEMHGIWIATVGNIDFPRCSDTASFCKEVQTICKTLKSYHVNAIFFQVRPNNDAFYPSKLNPWSRFLSGKEGTSLSDTANFDPLRYFIQEAHRSGMELHAWLNPYRVQQETTLSKQAYLKTLASNNFARLHPEWVLETSANGKRKLVLNPGIPQVRQFVLNTVLELARNYDLDGIHFDDYFYPDQLPLNIDAKTYRQYGSPAVPQDQWRRNNVTQLISTVHAELAKINVRRTRKIRFGVSPFGIWRNKKSSPEGSLTQGAESYAKQCADTRLWVKKQLIDYIAPQLYWDFNHDVAAYAALADWWSNTVKGTRVKLYIGQGLYRMGQPNWGLNELYYQLLYNRAHPEIKGSILFSYRSLVRPSNDVMKRGGGEMLKVLWKKAVVLPEKAAKKQ